MQIEFNEKHGIVPQTIQKDIRRILEPMESIQSSQEQDVRDTRNKIAELEALMLSAAENLEFEKAAHYRDLIRRIEKESSI